MSEMAPVQIAILRGAAALREQVAALAPRSLSEAERSRLGAFLFRGAPRLVHAVCQALTAEGALFPASVGPALRERQARAAAWLDVSVTLEALLQEARDSYVFEQSAAVKEALLIVSQTRHGAAAPGMGARRAQGLPMRQALALSAPLRILEERQKRNRRAALKRRRAEGRPQPAPRRPAPTSRDLPAALWRLYLRRRGTDFKKSEFES